MFDSLGEIWNANQQRLEQEGVRPGQMNTAGIAGQLIASGMMPQQAYVQAAKIFRDQEVTNIQKQKYEQQQQQQLQLAQLLQGGGQGAGTAFEQMSPQQKLGALVGSGQRLGDAAAAVTAIQPNPLQNTFKGPGGALYQAGTNPETKQIESKIIPGQLPEGNVLSTADKRAQTEQKADYARSATGAREELRFLKDLKKAYQGFDKHAGTFTKSGSFLASTENLPKLSSGQTANLIYSKEQLPYKNLVDKLNKSLKTAMIRSARPGEARAVAFQKTIEETLPQTTMDPIARKEVIAAKEREIAHRIIRNDASTAWEKLNNGDRTGSEGLMRYIEDSYEIVDENGDLNKQLEKDLPKVVKQYYDGLSTQEDMPIEQNPAGLSRLERLKQARAQLE